MVHHNQVLLQKLFCSLTTNVWILAPRQSAIALFLESFLLSLWEYDFGIGTHLYRYVSPSSI